MKTTLLLGIALIGSMAFADAGPAPDFGASTKQFRETLNDLVKADTTNPPGNEARAVEIIAARLRSEKIPYDIVDFGDNRKNIVARLKGNGSAKPLLLLAHLDVVGTKDQKWATPPHEVTEKDGFLYGRGVLDDLGMAVSNLETFIQLKRTGVPLRRDVIAAWTGDEESGGLGIRELIKQRPELIDAEIALNEGGAFFMNENGQPLMARIQAAEKTYQDFVLTARGTTGHSSLPNKDNAIYTLARALVQLDSYRPLEQLLPVTREYFRKLAPVEPPAMAKAINALVASNGPLPKKAVRVVQQNNILYVALITTCVPTMISGGTKVNALPAEANVTVNCRILPSETVDHVKERLAQIIHDPKVDITLAEGSGPGGDSPLTGPVPTAIGELTREVYPGMAVSPTMVSGATDSRFLRTRGVAAYGFFPFLLYEKDGARMHGIDERIPVASVRPGLENMYKLVLKLAAK